MEPTSGLEPLTCSLRVITQALQGCAGGCKSRISKVIPKNPHYVLTVRGMSHKFAG